MTLPEFVGLAAGMVGGWGVGGVDRENLELAPLIRIQHQQTSKAKDLHLCTSSNNIGHSAVYWKHCVVLSSAVYWKRCVGLSV